MKRLWYWIGSVACFVGAALLAAVGLGNWWQQRRRDKARRELDLAAAVAAEEKRVAYVETYAGWRDDQADVLADVRSDADAGDLNDAIDKLRRADGAEVEPGSD